MINDAPENSACIQARGDHNLAFHREMRFSGCDCVGNPQTCVRFRCYKQRTDDDDDDPRRLLFYSVKLIFGPRFICDP